MQDVFLLNAIVELIVDLDTHVHLIVAKRPVVDLHLVGLVARTALKLAVMVAEVTLNLVAEVCVVMSSSVVLDHVFQTELVLPVPVSAVVIHKRHAQRMLNVVAVDLVVMDLVLAGHVDRDDFMNMFGCTSQVVQLEVITHRALIISVILELILLKHVSAARMGRVFPDKLFQQTAQAVSVRDGHVNLLTARPGS